MRESLVWFGFMEEKNPVLFRVARLQKTQPRRKGAESATEYDIP